MSKKKEPSKKRLSPAYLEHVKMTSFGKFSNTIVGPLTPGLNVVYGPNEAGKTTLNELIKGVLFGWPSSRGQGNPYRPESSERVGSLFFRDSRTDEVVEVKRAKNSEGVSDPAGLLSDIDKETYGTIFALTSDELLRLDRHSEVTAHLLTAGSGTGSSPAHALDEVSERIKSELSRSAKNPDSIPNLREERQRLRALVHQGREEADALRAQEKELAALAERRELLSRTQQQLNSEIEKLKTANVRVGELDRSIAEARDSLQEALKAEGEASSQAEAVPPELAELVSLSKPEEYQLLDALDDFEERRAKLERSLDAAKMDAVRSESDYEVFADQAKTGGRKSRFAFQRNVKIGFALIVTLAMALAGSFVLYRAPDHGGLSYLVAGVALVVFSLVIAAAGIAMALKPAPGEDELDEELRKRKWVQQQDAKTVEACQRALQDFDGQVTGHLAANGLKAASGSLRRARRIMGQLADFRASQATESQNHQARTLQCASLRKELAECKNQRLALCRELRFSDRAAAEEFAQAVERKEEERARTSALAASAERQYGEISERLAAARSSTDFDAAKFECEQVEARLRETYRRLSVLFIAKRSLESAIAEWERKSQPEVYRVASRLLSGMTGGAWQQVRLNAQGELEVLDAVGASRTPNLLSLGTRQQLYLSLRIALLLTATNVGRALPVLCDDILVNFDDERRAQAATALAELAQHRQVILFTCHSDVAALMGTVDPRSNLIQL